MTKGNSIRHVFNRAAQLRRLTWLLIALLLFQSGFSFAAQCDEYPAEIPSSPELSKTVNTDEAGAQSVISADTSSKESKCYHCVLCKCGQIKFLAQHLMNSLVKPLSADQYFYFRNTADAPIESFLRPPQK
ncbi:MAG: hypothetical protein ABNH21_05140 [Glaciecola sp.]|jgi:hypothetical protein